MLHHCNYLLSLLVFIVLLTGCNRDALRGGYPQEGDDIPCGSTEFTWSKEGPDGVQFTLKEQEDKSVVANADVNAQAYTPSLLLKPGTAYTWSLKSGPHRFRADFNTLSVLASLGNQVEGTVCRRIYDSNYGSETTCEPGFLSLSLSTQSVNVGLVSDSLSGSANFYVNDPNALSYTKRDEPYSNATLTIGENYRDVDVSVYNGSLGHSTTYTFTNH